MLTRRNKLRISKIWRNISGSKDTSVKYVLEEMLDPRRMEVEKEISLFKKGKLNDIPNYRSISLLNTCYKIYSKLIKERLRKIADSILLEEQVFRKLR